MGLFVAKNATGRADTKSRMRWFNKEKRSLIDSEKNTACARTKYVDNDVIRMSPVNISQCQPTRKFNTWRNSAASIIMKNTPSDIIEIFLIFRLTVSLPAIFWSKSCNFDIRLQIR